MITSVEGLSAQALARLRSMVGDAGQAWLDAELQRSGRAPVKPAGEGESAPNGPDRYQNGRLRESVAPFFSGDVDSRKLPACALFFEELPSPSNQIWNSWRDEDGKIRRRKTERARNWGRWVRRTVIPTWRGGVLIGAVEAELWLLIGEDRPPSMEPDLPNISKLVYDTLEDHCFLNDVQIVMERPHKIRVARRTSALVLMLRPAGRIPRPPWLG